MGVHSTGGQHDDITLLDDDDDNYDVEEDEENPGRLVRDRGEAAAEQWTNAKEVFSLGRK